MSPVISLSVGLFGFHESLSASFVTQSLTIETITVIALLAWTVLVATTSRPPAGRSPRAMTWEEGEHDTTRNARLR